MKLKTLLLGALFSGSVFANGYWDYREVCDYEQVQVNTPVTTCTYFGSLTAFAGGSFHSLPMTYPVELDGHVSCPATRAMTVYGSAFDVITGERIFAVYTGTLGLNSQSQTYDVSYETRVVEGSCRIERVWVPLFENCEPGTICEFEP